QSLRVTAQSGLTEEEIEKIISDAEAHREADEVKKQVADIRNRAEGLLYSTERTLDEYADALDPLDVELIQSDLEQLKAALEGDGVAEIESLYKALETSAYRIAETIYAQR
ncbi:MAG: Hsp70 family protein, partial [Myxococcota bacterium]